MGHKNIILAILAVAVFPALNGCATAPAAIDSQPEAHVTIAGFVAVRGPRVILFKGPELDTVVDSLGFVQAYDACYDVVADRATLAALKALQGHRIEGRAEAYDFPADYSGVSADGAFWHVIKRLHGQVVGVPVCQGHKTVYWLTDFNESD